MLMNVHASHLGFLGDCGIDYKVLAVDDTYTCLDKEVNRKVHCEKNNSYVHLCCVEEGGCDNMNDLKQWIFNKDP
jgi:hypothetical protein